ncbi:hypothetical protein ID867_20465 [Streptomyces parvulus]|nr:hypothetical protein [Streptomyces parvulus]
MSRPRGNLRARLTSFVGRDADLEALRAILAAARLVTLLGPAAPARPGCRRRPPRAPESRRGTAPGSPNSPPSTTPAPYRRPC